MRIELEFSNASQKISIIEFGFLTFKFQNFSQFTIINRYVTIEQKLLFCVYKYIKLRINIINSFGLNSVSTTSGNK